MPAALHRKEAASNESNFPLVCQQAGFSSISAGCRGFCHSLQNSLVRVTGCNQGNQKFRNVVGTTRFHGDVDRRVTQVYAVVGTVVRRLHDIRSMVSQNSSQAV